MGKILNVGRQEISVRHFTTDITNLPFIMDVNCFMAFSHLWRKYIACSSNENLMTEDGWFQYPLKSLALHCGFMDMGTLKRAVEGLYRSGVVDVRVEEGSRLWACWKMNKEVIEKMASLSDRDAMDEPYLKSIESVESKDKDYTYLENKDGIEELKGFFGVRKKAEKPPNIVENPPLLNTITHEHYITLKQQYPNTISQYHVKTTEQEHENTATQQHYTDVVEGLKEPLDKDSIVSMNQFEAKSESERKDDSNPYQPSENNPSSIEEVKNLEQAIPTELRGCSKVVREVYTNVGGNLQAVLQELAASKPSEFRNLVALLKRNNSYGEDIKELAASLASAWGIKLY